ncbi:uncharacterized protein LOC135617752 isoform X3 [Musa acuminata AAA Group]|uniref:uncharacterized protein LOC135617752 isoform X3 n=1 Tax=Musa acuminata AAA Group TaxID=214697 RepID=UPI0031E0C2B7
MNMMWMGTIEGGLVHEAPTNTGHVDPSYWHHLYQRVRTSLSLRLLPSSTPNRFVLLRAGRKRRMGSTCHDPGNSLLPSATAGGESMMQRFPAPPPVPGIVPQPMYTPIPPPVTDHSSSQLQLDAHPVDRESLVSRVQEGFTSCLVFPMDCLFPGWCGTLMLQCSGFFGTEADLQLLWDRSHD